MPTIEFATYADKKYLEHLKYCLEGCRKLAKLEPTIYALDNPTYEQVQQWGYTAILYKKHQNPQVSSLYILKESKADILILIDADCWILRKDAITKLLQAMSIPNICGSGDIGFIDIPYLFQNIPKQLLFYHIHETFKNFPKFAKQWAAAKIITPERFSSGSVVDLPLLYGGLAAYRPNAFRDIVIPSWIHSADIWLAMYAIEQNLTWYPTGQFQFNRRFDSKYYAFHLAGPKPNNKTLQIYCDTYAIYLKEHI